MTHFCSKSSDDPPFHAELKKRKTKKFLQRPSGVCTIRPPLLFSGPLLSPPATLAFLLEHTKYPPTSGSLHFALAIPSTWTLSPRYLHGSLSCLHQAFAKMPPQRPTLFALLKIATIGRPVSSVG